MILKLSCRNKKLIYMTDKLGYGAWNLKRGNFFALYYQIRLKFLEFIGYVL